MNMDTKTKARAMVFDAFGTLLCFSGRETQPYRRIAQRAESLGLGRLPLLTRNVPLETWARELGMEDQLADIQLEINREIAAIRLFQEVPRVIQEMRDMNIKIAVCSNLAQAYGATLRALLPDFDAYILSYEVGLAKPDPAIFQAACEALECEPAEAVMVGDSMRSDVAGAQNAGLQARWLNRADGQTLHHALQGLELSTQRQVSDGASK
jgi:HAD superfamily hydrolase (TIGR01549 family)